MILAGYKSNAHLMGPAAESLKGLVLIVALIILYIVTYAGAKCKLLFVFINVFFLTILLPAQAALPDGHFLCLPDEGVPAFPFFLNSARSIVSSAWALHC